MIKNKVLININLASLVKRSTMNDIINDLEFSPTIESEPITSSTPIEAFQIKIQNYFSITAKYLDTEFILV
jgi:hypothetical protein